MLKARWDWCRYPWPSSARSLGAGPLKHRVSMGRPAWGRPGILPKERTGQRAERQDAWGAGASLEGGLTNAEAEEGSATTSLAVYLIHPSLSDVCLGT